MPTKNNSRAQYDIPTAVTFLVAGLAVGWLLTSLFSPSVKNASARQSVSQRLARLNQELYESAPANFPE